MAKEVSPELAQLAEKEGALVISDEASREYVLNYVQLLKVAVVVKNWDGYSESACSSMKDLKKLLNV